MAINKGNSRYSYIKADLGTEMVLVSVWNLQGNFYADFHAK